MAKYTHINLSLKTFLGFGLAMVFWTSSWAQTVSLESSPGFFLQAEFSQPVEDNKQVAVLVQHGFLTTNQFHTIRSMVSAINDQGIATLSPNMSYGISGRKDSLKCDSLHTHTLEDNRAEIGAWIDWLQAQGYQHVVLLGHSSGSQDLLFSQATEPHPAVELLILTSVFYFNGQDIGTKTSDLSRARNMMLTGSPRPEHFSFLFCKETYYATPQSFLSYHQLTRQQNLSHLQFVGVPVHAIMGTGDEILQQTGFEWLDELAAVGVKLHLVEGANHFFSSMHEFDLQDRLVQILNSYQSDVVP
ncbi:alpha/beta hydrolase [Thiomicrospira microaerophila]|uniref:alpha/beta hydrolase n=1 Tax=Thiomicrospira microaerophila TaxID=406020 RepID=UPI00200F7498|nr:alpha/beta hydrolase [Thiomicrospira microaerophila]UQB42120.1 alpha/beta hydrolase [Thiomicrospira microaerophila]